MPRKQNIKRNQEIVVLRKKNPDKYTFRALAEIFNIDVSAIYQIWKRDKQKY